MIDYILLVYIYIFLYTHTYILFIIFDCKEHRDFFVCAVSRIKLSLLISFARRKHDILVHTYSVFRHTYNLCLPVQVLICLT